MKKIDRIKHNLKRNSGSGRANYSRGYNLTGGYPNADRKRQLWDQFGYPDVVTPEMLFDMYSRNQIARAVVELLPDACWQSDPIIYDGDEDPKRRGKSPTEFEVAIDKYSQKWQLWHRLKGLDIRQRVQRYAGLIIECRERNKAESKDPISMLDGPDAIINLKPVYETQLVVEQAIQDPNSEEYGQPKYFSYRTNVTGSSNSYESIQYEVHPSRVVVWAEGADDGSIYGTPVLTGPYNSLLDLEKTRGAFAEGGYKNSKQPKVISFNREELAGLSDEQFNAITENIDKEARDHNGTLTVGGASVTSLQSTMINPEPIYAMAAHESAAAAKVPWTMIVGQQTGRLASDQDVMVRAQNAKARNETFLTPAVAETLKYLVKIGALPKPDSEITVVWPSITEPSDNDKAELAKKIAEVGKIMGDARMSDINLEGKIAELLGTKAESEDDEQDVDPVADE